MNARPRPVLDGGSKPADPLDVLIILADVRAYLTSTGNYEWHAAVDGLQAYAETSGLVDRIGQDAVQEIIADAFAWVPA